ncbi:hypothetical protein [Streptomyces griseorubiginosus]|uniref:hypothetical protein n=1 Tax=Streptomyces griseorubiginosus TaxID=67304 RepID=UPI002E813C61|nr:hypothetical protein [Streptomyces griseorubiginosus]WUB42022.1 hypothetical protein OHN19_01265 [Streptomyces griseorubiginosus]WUB50541.1 hypothetical protein OG942_01260 [Streptomyces griseorubiginosus]
MPDRSPVPRIINSAARHSLKPLGLIQRGRSRLWIDDHGWWLGIVEFTPPRLAGSGLYVGAMWLWHDVDHLAFHLDAGRVGSELFRSEDQFTRLAFNLGQQAAANVTALRDRFPALSDVARYLTSRPVRRGFLWDSFDSGIAAGLVGDSDTARHYFEHVLCEDALAPWMVDAQEKARDLHAIAADRDAVIAWVTRAVDSCRSKLGLGHGPLAIS